MNGSHSYFMENEEEITRLETKTSPQAVYEQAQLGGLLPGLRVLDAGCGAGKVTSILHGLVQPGGEAVGIDASRERIEYARHHYGEKPGIQFHIHNLMEPLYGFGCFDFVWARFVLEYYRAESFDIVKNLDSALKPGGTMCLIDLDQNCLNYFGLAAEMQAVTLKVMARLEQDYNFDPLCGRKLYSYLYDLGYRDIAVHISLHHLIYGDMREEEMYDWVRKMEVSGRRTNELYNQYPGGKERFFVDFRKFLADPRRFIYTPLILCKGTKPESV